MKSHKIAAIFAAATIFCTSATTPATAKPGAAEYGAHAMISRLTISPDGKHVAMIASYHDDDIVTISKIGGGICKLGSGGSKVRGVFWANDTRLIVEVSVSGEIPNDGGQNTFGEYGQAYSVDTNCSDTKKMNGNEVIGRLPDGDVLMEVYSYNNSTQQQAALRRWTKSIIKVTVHKVNPSTGKGPRYEDGGDFTYGWIADGQGRVRFRFDGDPGTNKTKVYARIGESKEWVPIFDGRDVEDVEQSYLQVVGVGSRPDTAYVRTRNGGDRYGIYEFDLRTRSITRPIFLHPTVDVDGLVKAGYTGEATGVEYVDQQPKIEYFDRTYAQMQADLEATFPGEQVRVTSVSRNRKQYIAYVEGATNPGGVYHYVNTESGEIAEVGKRYPGLSSQDISKVSYINYAARDGLSIPAYVTMPNGTSGRNLPLVVMPHGGPEARDVGGYDSWAQFLSSRGYVVLQPQFRGSDGFGKAFRNAGRFQWGQASQNDISDGVKHLISTGVADGNRVCIVGWSYGGYATLAGMTFSPELYKCGVAGAAVSDLPEMLAWVRKRLGRDMRADDYWPRVIGHPIRDHDKLAATSPARNASKVRAPILLIHGKDDSTVPIEQSEIMVKALAAANKQSQYIVISGDDHYLSKSKTGIEFFSNLESFLGQHLR